MYTNEIYESIINNVAFMNQFIRATLFQFYLKYDFKYMFQQMTNDKYNLGAQFL